MKGCPVFALLFLTYHFFTLQANASDCLKQCMKRALKRFEGNFDTITQFLRGVFLNELIISIIRDAFYNQLLNIRHNSQINHDGAVPSLQGSDVVMIMKTMMENMATHHKIPDFDQWASYMTNYPEFFCLGLRHLVVDALSKGAELDKVPTPASVYSTLKQGLERRVKGCSVRCTSFDILARAGQLHKLFQPNSGFPFSPESELKPYTLYKDRNSSECFILLYTNSKDPDGFYALYMHINLINVYDLQDRVWSGGSMVIVQKHQIVKLPRIPKERQGLDVRVIKQASALWHVYKDPVFISEPSTEITLRKQALELQVTSLTLYCKLAEILRLIYEEDRKEEPSLFREFPKSKGLMCLAMLPLPSERFTATCLEKVYIESGSILGFLQLASNPFKNLSLSLDSLIKDRLLSTDDTHSDSLDFWKSLTSTKEFFDSHQGLVLLKTKFPATLLKIKGDKYSLYVLVTVPDMTLAIEQHLQNHQTIFNLVDYYKRYNLDSPCNEDEVKILHNNVEERLGIYKASEVVDILVERR